MKAKSMPKYIAKKNKSKPHPTFDKLVNSAIDLMPHHSVREISSDMILENSGASRGSLYYHFEDLSDLIETASVRVFSQAVDDNISILTEAINSCKDKDQFYDAIIKFNDHTQSDNRKNVRLERINLISMSHNNPRLFKKISSEQERLNKAYSDLFIYAKNIGWISKDIDELSASIFIQAYTIGRIVDDISENHVDNEKWKNLIKVFIEKVLIN